MAISEYLRAIRQKVGNDLLLMPSVTALVWNSQDHLMLIRQQRDRPWTLPGGIVDPGEAPAQALVREVWEETGQIVCPERIVAVFGGSDGFKRTYPNGHQVEFVDTVFECRAIGGQLRSDGDEVQEARYFSRAELQGISLSYPIKLDVLLNKAECPYFTWDPRWINELGPSKRADMV
jgi:ADP-ribose pyrophosphatase YjhB (NUDIX family)